MNHADSLNRVVFCLLKNNQMSLQTEQPESSTTLKQAVMPASLRERFNGELSGQTIVAWAEFDLDEKNQFARQFAVLTETDLLILRGSGSPTSISIARIEEAKISEGLGVDRLVILSDGRRFDDLHYSRSHRRDM